MFPIHAKCVTFDAGYPKERERARENLVLGQIYTVRNMLVERSSSSLEFYEVTGRWNTAFFDAADWSEGFDSDGHAENCSRSDRCPGNGECK
jgi:hypothetical protein